MIVLARLRKTRTEGGYSYYEKIKVHTKTHIVIKQTRNDDDSS